MKVGLFIPCYIDQFYPEVGKASYSLLVKAGFEVFYSAEQTCCGQPLSNAGYGRATEGAEEHWLNIFKDCEVVVGPTGSCVYHINHHFSQKPAIPVYEISAFFLNYANLPIKPDSFKGNIAILKSCHNLRGLKDGNSSELMGKEKSAAEQIIDQITSLHQVFPERSDECCGFGGLFSVKEEAVSVAMGRQRIKEFIDCKAEIITGTDMSCLMHIDGIMKREKVAIEVIHIAEIINGSIQ